MYETLKLVKLGMGSYSELSMIEKPCYMTYSNWFALWIPQVDLGDDFTINRSSCECAMGDFECHHVAASLLFG